MGPGKQGVTRAGPWAKGFAQGGAKSGAGMQAGRYGAGMAMLALLVLAGCGDKTPNLMNLRSETRGPDEFGILPTKPLELPQDFAALPTPVPGGASRTDPTPQADAIAALGGRPAGGGGGAADGAMLSYATRLGVAPGIRATLADEDLAFRSANPGRPLERLFNITVYYRAYREQSLDQYGELAKWRARGLRTSSAPPSREAK